jgi:single-stranded-DNA-specific exonuclease
MEKRWVFIKKGEDNLVKNIEETLNVEPKIANLLIQRDISNYESAKKFFRPELTHLHDPFLMKGMADAINRMEKAIKKKEKILIYGDYDVDGTTAVALVYSFLKSFYANIDYYIPDRYSEGYGISFQGIDFATENGFALIIALDCGIKSNDKIDYANTKNVDFIICDHHLPGTTIPKAIAVLDPKQKDCNYPFKELSGCGIGFKLIQAYSSKNNMPFENLYQYLDLTAISIGSDIVPILDENRTLAFFGLKEINSKPRPGIKAILELTSVKKELTITDLVFIVGPRINAAGRIASGKNAVKLLLTKTTDQARDSGLLINANNTERKGLDAEITQQALEIINNNEQLLKNKTTVLFDKNWHKGVIGIVASRLIETYYRPTILLAESNGKATGSARSVKDFDVHQAIESCSDLLEQFGGHKYAAGLTLKLENIEAFMQKFEKIVSETIEDHLLIPQIEIDSTLKLIDITPKFQRIIKQFSPFGPGNMAPVFASYSLNDRGYAKIVGGNHLKMDVFSDKNPEISFQAIAFNLGHHFDSIKQGNSFNICYAIEENEWNGKTTIQLNIKDLNFQAIP